MHTHVHKHIHTHTHIQTHTLSNKNILAVNLDKFLLITGHIMVKLFNYIIITEKRRINIHHANYKRTYEHNMF